MSALAAPDAPSPALCRAVDALWALRPPLDQGFFQSAEFLALDAACCADYGGKPGALAASSALSNALHSLGLPCRHPDPARWGDASAAAAGLAACFTMRERRLVHLCPFDVADLLPPVAFGPARIVSFSPSELESLLGIDRLRRWAPGWTIDPGKLAELQWLVVEEVAAVAPEPGERALPFLYTPVSDWGRPRVQPHASWFPQVVAEALSILLLAPWEDWNDSFAGEWRGFRLPWTHTLDPDLAVRTAAPPGIEGFAWEPDPRYDDEDHERLAHYPLDDAAGTLTTMVSQLWTQWQAARQSELFSGPVAHFLVTAFANTGIDEFMAHITVVEAALGVPSDHFKRPTFKALRSTERIARRIAALLDDDDAAATFRRLFKVRSQFVHGRAMETVPVENLDAARRLARRVSAALLARAAAEPSASRDAVLAGLLAAGAARPAQSERSTSAAP